MLRIGRVEQNFCRDSHSNCNLRILQHGREGCQVNHIVSIPKLKCIQPNKNEIKKPIKNITFYDLNAPRRTRVYIPEFALRSIQEIRPIGTHHPSCISFRARERRSQFSYHTNTAASFLIIRAALVLVREFRTTCFARSPGERAPKLAENIACHRAPAYPL